MYIAQDLNAPQAAANLVQEIHKKVKTLRDMPYMYCEYHGLPSSKILYRAIPIKKYIIFYTVYEDRKIVEIHRVLYSRMDFNVLLK